MRKLLLFAAAAASSWSTAALAQPAGAPADDATRFVTTIIDKFNGGDTKAWLSAQQDNAMIVDEFGPHMWAGPGSPKRWLDAYAQDFEGKRSHWRKGRLWQAAPGDERRQDRLCRPADDVPLRPEGHENGRAGQHDLRHGSRCEGVEDRQLDLFRGGHRRTGEVR